MARHGKKAAFAALAVGAAAIGLALRLLLGSAVDVVAVQRREIVQRVVATGHVLPLARISVGSLVSGAVTKVRVDEGAKVEEGELLVQLEDSEARAAAARAKAGAEQAEARLEKLRLADAPLAEEALREAEAEARRAEAEAERQETLFRSNAATQQELDEARKSNEVAKSRVASARIRLQSAGKGGAEERLARASVAEAHAALLEAEARLDHTRIESPVPGIVLTRTVEPGDAVQPGKTLLVLARGGRTRLEVAPDEKSLAFLAIGQVARVSADAFPAKVFEAKVAAISPSVDPARGTIDVKLDVDSPPAFLLPDMTVSVDVEVARKAGALVLPREAVREVGSPAPWVLAVREGRTVKVPVTLGISGDGVVEVSGLDEGDLAVLAGTAVGAGVRVRAHVRKGS